METASPRFRFAPDGSTAPATPMVWRPVQIPAPPSVSARLSGKRVAIINGAEPTARRVAVALERHGAVALRPTEPFHDGEVPTAALCAEMAAVDVVIDLGLEAPFDPGERDAWKAPFQRS